MAIFVQNLDPLILISSPIRFTLPLDAMFLGKYMDLVNLVRNQNSK